MIGFISLFAMLAAVPAYFSICRKENPERITLMALLANVLLFYLFSIFHLMNVGAGIIMAVNFAFFIPVIRQLLREPAAYRRFLTPAMTVYFMLIPVLYAATYYLEFVQWDEFSHWGFVSKLLFCNGRLNCELDNYLEHASYPPGIPLIGVFIHKCFSWYVFGENIIFFANSLTVLTIMLSFASDDNKSANIPIKLCAITGGCMLLFFMIGDWVCLVYSEPLLISLGSLILFRVFTSEEKIFDDLEMMILLMVMILLKASATGVIIFAILFYLIRVWRHRECRNGKLEKFLPAVVCVMPFLVKASWSLLLKYFNTDIVFAPRKPLSETLGLLISGKHEYAGKVALVMLQRFFADITLYGSFLVLIAVAVVYCLKSKNKPAEWKVLYFVFMPLFFLLMMFSLWMSYITVFNRFQALNVVSFERYAMTFLGMLLFIQLYLLFREKFLQNAGGIWFKAAIMFCVTGSICNMMLSQMQRSFRIDTKWRKEANYAQYIYTPLLYENDFTVLSREGDGMKNFIYRYLFPESFKPVAWFNPVVPDGEANMFQVKMTPEELLENLNKTAEYVLIETMDEKFFTDYQAIFAEGHNSYKSQALYRITPQGLEYVPPVVR